MNFLAHLLIADRAGADLVGAVLPDMGSEGRRDMPEHVRSSCDLHRRLDAFVDGHAAGRTARACFAAEGHYAGVAGDICFDHCLADTWERWHHEPLERFAACCYDAFESADHLTPRLAERLGSWREHRVLESAASLDGIRKALTRIQRRAKRRFTPERVLAAFREHRYQLDTAFEILWQDAIVAFIPPANAAS